LKKSSLKKLWNKKDEIFRNVMYNILSIHLNESSADCIDVILSYHGPFIISKIRYSVDLLLFFDQSIKKPLKYVWKEAKCENKHKFVDVDILKVCDHSSDEYFGQYRNLLSLWNLDEYANKFEKNYWCDTNKWNVGLKYLTESDKKKQKYLQKQTSELIDDVGFKKGHVKIFNRRLKEYKKWKEGDLPWREDDNLIFDEFEMEEMNLEHLDSVYAKFAEHVRFHFGLTVKEMAGRGYSGTGWLETSALFAVSQVHKGKTETFVFEIPGDRSRERLNTKRWFYKLYLQQMCKLKSIKGELAFKMDLIAIMRIKRTNGSYTAPKRGRDNAYNEFWSDCWDTS